MIICIHELHVHQTSSSVRDVWNEDVTFRQADDGICHLQSLSFASTPSSSSRWFVLRITVYYYCTSFRTFDKHKMNAEKLFYQVVIAVHCRD